MALAVNLENTQQDRTIAEKGFYILLLCRIPCDDGRSPTTFGSTLFVPSSFTGGGVLQQWSRDRLRNYHLSSQVTLTKTAVPYV